MQLPAGPSAFPTPSVPPQPLALVTFEPDAEVFNQVGYWDRTAAIDWCERNYVYSFYVAEMWNTLSNVFFMLMAVWGLRQCRTYGLEPRFYVGFLTVLFIGIGSTAFHMTLSRTGQQGDESPMIVTLLAWAYCLVWMQPDFERRHPRAQRISAYFCFFLGVTWTIAHYIFGFILIFQLTFGIVVTVTGLSAAKETRHTSDANARFLGVMQAVMMGSAFILWLIDCNFCEQLYVLPFNIPNPQFHAWWHTMAAFAVYLGPSFIIYRRAVLLGRYPVTGRLFGVFPYVHIPSSARSKKGGEVDPDGEPVFAEV